MNRKERRNKKKEKKIIFSEVIDDSISGFALVITFIVVGIFLLFNKDYFGNETVAIIIQWLFIIIGCLGFSTEISKMNKNRGIKGIDNLIKVSETLTDFPIIKTIAFVLKGAYNSEKELGRVVLILNNIIDVSKSKMLARLYKAYINKKLTWEEFREYSEIVNRIFLEDIELLRKINDGKVTFINEDDKEKYRIHRLNSIGVIEIGIDWITVAILNGSSKLKQLVTINDVGKKFLEIVLDSNQQNIILSKNS